MHALELLLDHVGVASVLPELGLKPGLQAIERLRPHNRTITATSSGDCMLSLLKLLYSLSRALLRLLSSSFLPPGGGEFLMSPGG